MKAVKNTTELEGFRQSHIRDGSALARYFAWLEEQLNNGVELNESQGADQLEKFRSWVLLSHLQFPALNIGSSELDLFKGLSFTTISSSGPNGGMKCYIFVQSWLNPVVYSHHPLFTGS
jgi:Xaa-Pro aminopeptidase